MHFLIGSIIFALPLRAQVVTSSAGSPSQESGSPPSTKAQLDPIFPAPSAGQTGSSSLFSASQSARTLLVASTPAEPAQTAQESQLEKLLKDPLEEAEELPPPILFEEVQPAVRFVPEDAPFGFSGPSGVAPTEYQSTTRFDPVHDRWRIGFPDSDRYGKGHPAQDDYLGVEGRWWDPYNQNVLKGDYPLIGIDKFLRLTGRNLTLFEGRQLPTPTTPFEATRNAGAAEFFGDPDSYLFVQNNALSIEMFQGSSSFKPMDWRAKFTFIYNLNHLVADELAVVSPDVRDGQSRFRQDFTLEEWFLETKLMDTSPYDDFVSVRVGSQFFNSDFRGFIFSDLNRGVRLFGTREANRDQFNLMWLDQTEKDTNSLLNRFDKDRHQNTLIANYYRQDVLFPGYNVSTSFHYNRDKPSLEFDRNNFLVRPDPVGVFSPHDVRSYYVGFSGNGHMERINVSNALYYVFGRDELNPIAGRRQDISAWMAALELSYDRDWMRFRTSYLLSSGDAEPNNSHATGFDAIFPNPNFAGAEFSYWGRQGIRLFGVELTNRLSLVPSMKNGKFQAQTNFVNPGLHLFNLGLDADITPKFKLIHNTNFLWFNQTEVLETFLFTGDVRNFIGTDVSLGAEYRPLLNNNVLMIGGFSTLFAGEGFRDLYQELSGDTRNHLAAFLETVLEY